MPAVTRSNVDWALARMTERVGNPYVYGGELSPTNVRQGCDCSALVAHVLNAVIYGPAMSWRRVDPSTGAWITTESWRPIEVGERGPFGTITAASARAIPADAPVKIALHHGPGGGVASHMWCELDGRRFECAGDKGLCTGQRALAISDPYANDWAYLPGPVTGSAPTGDRLTLGSSGPAVLALQIGMARVFPFYSGNVQPTGRYDEPTAAAVAEFQRRIGIPATGQVGPETRAELGRYGIDLTGPSTPPAATPSPSSTAPSSLTDRQLLEQIWQQLRGPTGNGWPQLQGHSVVDALADAIYPTDPTTHEQ